MIELVFIACLTLTPDACEERRLSRLPENGLMSCMMSAQPQLAQWTAAHPNHRIVRWSCEWADSRAMEA